MLVHKCLTYIAGSVLSHGAVILLQMLATLESKTQFGWFYLRYKTELWWYEFVIFTTKASVIASSMFFNNRTVQASVISAILVFAVLMHLWRE